MNDLNIFKEKAVEIPELPNKTCQTLWIIIRMLEGQQMKAAIREAGLDDVGYKTWVQRIKRYHSLLRLPGDGRKIITHRNNEDAIFKAKESFYLILKRYHEGRKIDFPCPFCDYVDVFYDGNMSQCALDISRSAFWVRYRYYNGYMINKNGVIYVEKDKIKMRSF